MTHCCSEFLDLVDDMENDSLLSGRGVDVGGVCPSSDRNGLQLEAFGLQHMTLLCSLLWISQVTTHMITLVVIKTKNALVFIDHDNRS